MTSAAPAPLALVGAGSLGQAFAGLLARSGQPVTVLATPGTAKRLHAVGAVRLREKHVLATAGVESYSSMTQDVLAGRAIEVDEVFADIVARGERAGVAVPRLALVRDLLRGLDPGRHPG